MNLRNCLFAVLFIFAANISSAQEIKGGLTWYTDAKQADKVSKSSGKPIFAFFTGSDWCGWCIRLQKDVFSKKAFIDWATNNVVLLELDFPRRKQLPPELAQQNMELQQALQVRGYPTIWLMRLQPEPGTGKVNIVTLGSLGYPSGSIQGREEEKFLNDANEFLKRAN